MKRIINLMLSFMILFSLCQTRILAQTEPGLYAYFGQNENQEDIYGSDITVSIDTDEQYQLKYFDGESYQDVSASDLELCEGLQASDGDDGFVVLRTNELFTDLDIIHKNGGKSLKISSCKQSAGIIIQDENGDQIDKLDSDENAIFYLNPIDSQRDITISSVEIFYQLGVNNARVDVPFQQDGNKIILEVFPLNVFSLQIVVKSSDGTIDYEDVLYLMLEQTILFDGKNYRVGLSAGETNGDVPIGIGSYLESDGEEQVWESYLLNGEFSEETFFCHDVNQELVSEVEFINAEIINSTYGDGKTSLSYETNNNDSGYTTTKVILSISENAFGSLLIKTTFKYNNVIYSTTDCIELYELIRSSIDLTAEDMPSFNEIFSSYESLNDWLEERNPDLLDQIDEATSLEINLPSGNYSGKFIVDLSGFSMGHKIIFINGNHEELPAALWLGIEEFEVEQFKNKTTINGTLFIKGGLVEASYIDFEENDDVKSSVSSLEIEDKTIAFYGEGDQSWDDDLFCSPKATNLVSNYCTYSGYDYGLVSTDTANVGSCSFNEFNDCVNGLYFDCHNKEYACGGYWHQGNIFTRCYNAVTFLSLENNMASFAIHFTFNEFYDNDIDFRVGQTGNYYFTENYFGSKTTNGVRMAKLNYANEVDAKIVTNPCFRYPGNNYPLGIDPADGLHTRLFNGVSSSINKRDLFNIKTMGIDFIDEETNENKELGKVIIGD